MQGLLRSLIVLASLGLSAAAARPAPPAPPLAKNLVDVITTTAGSFMSIGSVGFVFTAAQETMARAAVSGGARKAVPRFVLRAALTNAQRWGRVTAGFAGGRALGQVWRGEDDQVCAILGAVAGGIAASNSVADIPGSVFTFVAFSYALDRMGGGSPAPAAQGGTPGQMAAPPSPQPTPGQRLDKFLGATRGQG